ncbi:hypothetical protein MBLNU459_g4209t1 [Dothideomycetes sp. NU459]
MAPSRTADHDDIVDASSNTTQHARPLRRGIFVPTVAFFNSDEGESVDVETTAKHAKILGNSGVVGIVTHGSNGEAVHLDHAERMLITQTTRKALDEIERHSMPIIVGCGAHSTKETITLCREAAASGGDYALVLPPSYYGSLLSSADIQSHFLKVADASPVPLIIYNFPGAASGLDLDSDQIIALSKHANIVGVKLTCGNTGKLARVAAAAPKDFLTTGGSADFLLQTLVAGGQGVIAGLGNLAPKACVKVMELYEQGKVEQAREMQAVVARGDWVAIKGGFVAVKCGLQAYGGYGGRPRLPCVLPGEASQRQLTESFAEMMNLEKKL